MRTHRAQTRPAVPPRMAAGLQRRCACGTHIPAGRECAQCARARLADAANANADARTPAAGWQASVGAALQVPGRALPAGLRGFMENRFQHDFSRVRIHDDAPAARSAQAVRARAYTVGADLVFGAGQFAPDSRAGRYLLAHELAHVVEQGARGQARLQRKLLVDGSAKDIAAFEKLLEPASGLKLKVDRKKPHAVSASVADPKPKSPALAQYLQKVIDDPDQDAQLTLGRNQPGVGFGKFPGDDSKNDKPMTGVPLVQVIDLADLEAVEKDVPGSGAALLIHEIVENYGAHSQVLTGAHREHMFEWTHADALKAEAQVAGELVAPGDRVAESSAPASGGVIRTALDYTNYFLVYDQAKSGITKAQKVGRVKVNSYRIGGFKKGANALPTDKATTETIAKIVADMTANPWASARIEGARADDPHDPSRLDLLQEAILKLGKADAKSGFDIRDFHSFVRVPNDSAKFATEVVVTIERPDL